MFKPIIFVLAGFLIFSFGRGDDEIRVDMDPLSDEFIDHINSIQYYWSVRLWCNHRALSITHIIVVVTYYFRPAVISTRTRRFLISKDWWACTRRTKITPNWNNCCLTVKNQTICRRLLTPGNIGRIALPLEKSGTKVHAGLVGYN